MSTGPDSHWPSILSLVFSVFFTKIAFSISFFRGVGIAREVGKEGENVH